MTLNNVIAVGDDQAWKAEVERQITLLQNQLTILTSQVNAQRQ